MQNAFAVEMRGITKRFGTFAANNRVTLSVRPGSIHAVVGENGAGKSTLMKVLYGMLAADEGSIAIEGAECLFRSPKDAIDRGIAMVHQHFMLIPPLSVLENIILGSEPLRRPGFIDKRAAAGKISRLAEAFNLPVNLDTEVSALSVGMQQRVEILKTLYRDGRIVIFDEPTGVLTPQEIDAFFSTLKALREKGKSILLITHKLTEVLEVSDEITVMRHGEVTMNVPANRATKEELAEAIIGRKLAGKDSHRSAAGTRPIAEIDKLSAADTGREVLKKVSLTLQEGEILGVAGVEGSGQIPLVQILAGLRGASEGSVRRIGGADSAVAHIPEDRHREGLILDFTVEENLILGRSRSFGGPFLLDPAPVRTFAQRTITELDVRPPDPEIAARRLSGGNQQKLVVGRELAKGARLIIAHQPTRGLDIGAQEFVHNLLIAQRNAGNCVLLLSSDLTELLELADRIAVMFDGSVVAVKKASDWTERTLGAAMTGMS
jgi:simple sugar transport system ATP-binding protein